MFEEELAKLLEADSACETRQEPIKIRTHDRIAFRRCRRMWDFVSQMRQHLEPIPEVEKVSSPLWFGTGFHFALEDYHGYRRFKNPVDAFMAYVRCFKVDELPEDFEELIELGQGMLEYYTKYWLPKRNEFETLWIDGVPQVEVKFTIPIPELSEAVGREVVYQGTFDRVVTDALGRLWVVDYKTVSRFDTSKLETDPQISAYAWAAEQWYQKPVEGVVYMQFIKAVPKPPKILRTGWPSLDKKQKTTYALYYETLLQICGDPKKFPTDYVEFLNYLASLETPEGDNFIRWDFVRRNEYQKRAEYQSIIAEGLEMLNPNLALYKNPTRDCAWDCAFRSVCLAMDDGGDWEWLLSQSFRKQGEEKDWRSKIKWPDEIGGGMKNE